LPSTVARKSRVGQHGGIVRSRRTALPVDRSTTMMPLPAAAEESGMLRKARRAARQVKAQRR